MNPARRAQLAALPRARSTRAPENDPRGVLLALNSPHKLLAVYTFYSPVPRRTRFTAAPAGRDFEMTIRTSSYVCN